MQPIVCALFAGVFSVFHIGNLYSKEDPTSVALELKSLAAELSVDVGLFPTSERKRHELVLLNKTGGKLEISGFESSCGCVAAYTDSKEVLGNIEMLIRVELATDVSGPFEKKLLVKFVDQPNPVSIRIFGESKPRLVMSKSVFVLPPNLKTQFEVTVSSAFGVNFEDVQSVESESGLLRFALLSKNSKELKLEVKVEDVQDRFWRQLSSGHEGVRLKLGEKSDLVAKCFVTPPTKSSVFPKTLRFESGGVRSLIVFSVNEETKGDPIFLRIRTGDI